MSQKLNFEEAIKFIRQYNLGPDNPSYYDFNGVVHLMLAAIDNLRDHALEAELEDIGYSMTNDQRFFLMKIAKFGCNITDEEIEAEED